MTFAEKIRQLRTQKNMTQKEVADAIGVSKLSYINYETGRSYPRTMQRYQALSDLFGVSVNFLRTEDEDFIEEAQDKYGSRGKREAQELVTQLSGLFAGGSLSEEDRDAVMRNLEKAYWAAKNDNKKYTPKRFRQQ